MQQQANVVCCCAPILAFAVLCFLVVDSYAKALQFMCETKGRGFQILVDVTFNQHGSVRTV